MMEHGVTVGWAVGVVMTGIIRSMSDEDDSLALAMLLLCPAVGGIYGAFS